MNTNTELKPISALQLNLLRHAIGYDDAGNDRFPNARSMDERRNRFVTDEAHRDGVACLELCAAGLMKNFGPQRGMGGMSYFSVTDAGRDMVLFHKPTPKKLSRSQRRYQVFLDSDTGLRFGEWLRTKWGKMAA